MTQCSDDDAVRKSRRVDGAGSFLDIYNNSPRIRARAAQPGVRGQNENGVSFEIEVAIAFYLDPEIRLNI